MVYKAEHDSCRRFPEPASGDLRSGVSRNFQVFDPLDFLAEVTQHIPNKGEHTIRYYGWYSNKSRGMRAKLAAVKNIDAVVDAEEEDTPFRKACRSRWAALIKKVYEVDPLKCPKCAGRMRIISFIEKKDQADKLLIITWTTRDRRGGIRTFSEAISPFLSYVPASHDLLRLLRFLNPNCKLKVKFLQYLI